MSTSQSLRGRFIRGLFLTLALCAISAPVLADAISIRADEWLPYNGPSSRKPPGYMIEIAERIAAANGHSIDYRTMPWADALEAVRKGDFDCVVGALLSDAEGFAFPAQPWGRSQQMYFALNDNPWRYNGLDSLANVRLAVIDGYSYSEQLDAYIEQHRKDPKRIIVVEPIGRAVVNAVSRLVSKTADVIIEDVNVANGSLVKMGMSSRVVPVGAEGEPGEIYIACTPAKPTGKQYADMFSKGTTELRNSGELAKILANYSVKDWMTVE